MLLKMSNLKTKTSHITLTSRNTVLNSVKCLDFLFYWRFKQSSIRNMEPINSYSFAFEGNIFGISSDSSSDHKDVHLKKNLGWRKQAFSPAHDSAQLISSAAVKVRSSMVRISWISFQTLVPPQGLNWGSQLLLLYRITAVPHSSNLCQSWHSGRPQKNEHFLWKKNPWWQVLVLCQGSSIKV